MQMIKTELLLKVLHFNYMFYINCTLVWDFPKMKKHINIYIYIIVWIPLDSWCWRKYSFQSLKIKSMGSLTTMHWVSIKVISKDKNKIYLPLRGIKFIQTQNFKDIWNDLASITLMAATSSLDDTPYLWCYKICLLQ